MALVKQGTIPQVMSMGRLQFHLNTLLAAVLSLAVVGALNAVRDSTPFKSTTGLDVVASYGFPAPFYLSARLEISTHIRGPSRVTVCGDGGGWSSSTADRCGGGAGGRKPSAAV